MLDANSYEQMIIRSIFKNNEYDITHVSEYKSLKLLLFKKEQYSLIVELIKQNRIDEIKEIDNDINDLREYLDIVKFTDKNKRTFIATVYDSDELMQDPQIIDIFYCLIKRLFTKMQ